MATEIVELGFIEEIPLLKGFGLLNSLFLFAKCKLLSNPSAVSTLIKQRKVMLFVNFFHQRLVLRSVLCAMFGRSLERN